VIAVDNAAHASFTQVESDSTERLARFFPDALPVQFHASLQWVRRGTANVKESVLVEFAGAQSAIFRSALPLEFEDRLLLEREAGQRLEAKVVAVQYHEGRNAVAVEILNGPLSWMNRP
jgi:hypothetical protein